jgi:putative Holliday junction resolvase
MRGKECEIITFDMRVIGIDVGARRIGLAISDATGTLARPLETIAAGDDREAADRVASRIADLEREDDGVGAVVVGMPRKLDGSPTDATARVSAFVEALRARTRLPIEMEDERLTSVEAERRLASRERDWKKRKEQIDAVAAAIILQDYLDRGGR